ncbi:bifunctional DNA-formamidopyrimidine glycosylase/DNA-(apurinic or apyrimidinic site) lyase [Sphingomonas sp. S2-65]|uniref:bifunctional DNA-formamidopyrimidine glycosylase/DNA-(apurinic or apyrimidinic site) lyase n=1 Tax=Sphingomonas sp. S2-65 TaxID=2903960 RepID=UPI001F333FDC|nr:bifunctional DNA-formamidopyrimidine glycosylase/DNA-(apurinic or apyrimidinic site) lyase [Sphingomonas sp. S2-65]UYY58544.1 bifunctional DNA-formamidopyrimidine glycosylase/DNA-(apurinic or apyrimidinic site) lyase [Sphingomonas sp. S2-65]
MPELPEVETTVRGLRPVLEGQVLERVTLRRGDLRRPFPEGLGQHLSGARVTGLGRRAKYGLIDTDRGDTLIFHLGMSGRWRIDPEELGKHDHFVLETGKHRLALNDARRFGSLDLVPTAGLDAWPAFAALGPEPLGSGFTAAHLAAKFKDRIAPVKALLLDQRVVAGLGNIYVCEALFLAGIAPTRAAGTVTRPRLAKLVDAVREVLEAAIAAGGSTLRDYARPDGELGYFAKQWRVYGREGEPCACGGLVERRVDGGRSTFWCPRCQK